MTPFSLIRILEINIEGKMNNLYQAIKFLGSKTRTISLCMITHDISKQITQWDYKIRKLDGVGSKRDRHKISIHCVINIIAHHNGFSVSNSTPLQKYLGLKEGK